MRSAALAASLFLLVAKPACPANAFSPDASDLWWNADESGWGVNIIQQSNILFATLFVYGPDGRARWYVASEIRCPGTPLDQLMVCRGTLYEATGPVVTSGPFNPAAVTRRAVGEATFQYVRPNNGDFSYTIDGVTVSKRVRRQTWAVNDITGEYNGMRVTRDLPFGCGNPNQVDNQALGAMTVSQSGSAVTISTRLGAPPALSCTYSGTYSQEGRMGAITGTYSCSDATSGSFTLSEIEVSKHGFIAHIATNLRGCNAQGHFGGTRATVDQVPD